jgi:hypothetical protein
MIKVIDSAQYHVWSDALHALQLARTTANELDRGAYVRWAVHTAWSAFEQVCADALEAKTLGMRFKDQFNDAARTKGLEPVEWGKGIWQKVLQVYETRKKFTHVVPTIERTELMPPVSVAEEAIATLRKGIKEVLALVEWPHPGWVDDDLDSGWKGQTLGLRGEAHATAIRSGARADDPNAIRIAYVLRGKEHISDICPPETDHAPLLDKLVASLTVPVQAVRAYRGSELIAERDLTGDLR